MSKLRALLIAAGSVLCLAGNLLAEPAVVALARSYLGPQSTLDSITSIHYVGRLERVDPDDAGKAPQHGTLDMIFAKPLRQRLVVAGSKTTMVTVLDGYDGWDQLIDNADPKRFRVTWLAVGDVRTLRSNTWENLYYYRIPNGGVIEDKGPVKIDGIDCERVDFAHSAGIVYERYFDRDTGRLVLTVRGRESFKESGELRVNGVRFPKRIVSTTKSASGKEVVSTAEFDSITLNEPLAPSLFAAPEIVVAKDAPAPEKK